MKSEIKSLLENDIINYLETSINKNIGFYGDEKFYRILNPDELIFIYDNTYPGYETIPLIKDTEQYCFMSLFGEPITITEFFNIKSNEKDPEEDYIDSFEIYFQSDIDELISDLKSELNYDDSNYFDGLKYLIISRTLKELNKTIKR